MKNLYIFALIIWIYFVGIRCENCDTGFEYNNSTQQCEDIDECNLGVATPCNGNALRPICNNTDGSYRCQCRPGPTRYYGPDCNSTDPAADLICADNQDGCYNNGTCQDFEKCICKAGFLGKHCELMTADDCPNLCWNNGTCVRNKTMSTPYCTCPVGYNGIMCQYKLNLCNQTEDVCLNGGTCMPDMYPSCNCQPGYGGNFCENNNMINITCQQCQENSTLTVNESCEMDDSYSSCPCRHGFYGTLCQYSMRECQNGGVDVPKPPPTYSTCICPEGVSGDSCEVDTVNECNNVMCQNGGNCMDMPGYYMCNCTYGWMGRYCEQRDPNVVIPTTPKPSTCMNSSFCPFDQEPWMNCANYMQCQSKFMDKTCDRECATEDCLFDGYDCILNITETCPNFTCSLLYGNGVCDMECNIPECENDGNDCLYKNETSMYFLGAIILDVKIADLSQLIENVSTEFLYLARIFPANLTSNYPARIVPRRRGSNSKADVPIIIPMNSSMGEMFYRGYYDVFNKAGCNETCWSSIQSFVNYFAASESMQTNNRYSLQAVTACMEGYYGDNCTMKCSENCKTMDNVPVCDMSDGRCTSGCINSSYVGSKCNAMCSGNCLSSVCNSDGTCNTTLNGRCTAGYMGERCDQMCMSGKYGVDCNMTCDAMCTSTCDSMTGYCQCKDGYTFKRVCIVCMDGYYGTNCSMSCNENCNMKKCNKTNGVCDKPCSKGYKGDKCEQVCEVGEYGANCGMKCNANCLNNRCHFENGNCESCKAGYTGDTCQSPDQLVSDYSEPYAFKIPMDDISGSFDPLQQRNTRSQQTTTQATRQDSSSTVIAVIVVLVIMLLVALIIAYILWRRSQGGQYETAEIEQKGLVLNNMESTKKNNEHVEMQNAAMVNETENKETEKAPLIGEGKQFETVDLTTPTEEKGDNLAAGGVFDGRAEETPKELEETPKESEETPKESDAPADVKNNDAVPKAEEGGDAENVKTDGIETPPPPPVEKAGTEGTPADDNDVSKAPDEANKPTGDTMQESQPSHKPVEATISVMSLPPPPEESGDKIRESLDVDNIPPPAEGSSPKNNVSEAESVKSDDKVGDDMKAEEQTKNESTSDDKKDSTETSVDTENT